MRSHSLRANDVGRRRDEDDAVEEDAADPPGTTRSSVCTYTRTSRPAASTARMGLSASAARTGSTATLVTEHPRSRTISSHVRDAPTHSRPSAWRAWMRA